MMITHTDDADELASDVKLIVGKLSADKLTKVVGIYLEYFQIEVARVRRPTVSQEAFLFRVKFGVPDALLS